MPNPSRASESVDGRLDDAVHHAYRAAWWGRDSLGNIRIRILPVAGPQEGSGIMTGAVRSLTGCAFAESVDLPLILSAMGN